MKKPERSSRRLFQAAVEIDKENIGMDTGFFDLGGDSLKILLLTSRVNKFFKKSFSVANMFNMPTITLLVKALDSSLDVIDTTESLIEPDEDLRSDIIKLFGQ